MPECCSARWLGLESDDTSFAVRSEDATARGGPCCRDRKGSKRYVSPALSVKLYQLTQVHTIEMIASQDEYLLRFSTADAVDLAAQRVRCSLAPARAVQRLFRPYITSAIIAGGGEEE